MTKKNSYVRGSVDIYGMNARIIAVKIRKPGFVMDHEKLVRFADCNDLREWMEEQAAEGTDIDETLADMVDDFSDDVFEAFGLDALDLERMELELRGYLYNMWHHAQKICGCHDFDAAILDRMQ